MDWLGKKVLVTGAEGFIGSHLVERLVSLGADVKCFIRYNFKNDWGFIEDFSPEIKDKIKVIASDITDSDAVRHAAKDTEIIFHLAAFIGIPYSYSNPRDVVNTNIIGTLNVLTAAREYNIKMIHTSTSETYGTAKYAPIDENHPLQGQSPYSASKIGADKLAESFYLSFNTPVAIIRPFNTYGPRQSARAVIPTIISQALQSDIIKLGSLTPQRDYTFVNDTVDGFIKVAESDKSIGQVINIGSGTEISIGELAKKIFAILGKDVNIVEDKERVRPDKGEVGRLLADNTKAKELLGWQPETSFEEGLKQTIEYIKNNLDNYKSDIYNQ
jgi:NAD dependent epimerase/dehydratase